MSQNGFIFPNSWGEKKKRKSLKLPRTLGPQKFDGFFQGFFRFLVTLEIRQLELQVHLTSTFLLIARLHVSGNVSLIPIMNPDFSLGVMVGQLIPSSGLFGIFGGKFPKSGGTYPEIILDP